jgi:transcription elongation GreA/GreB family factor
VESNKHSIVKAIVAALEVELETCLRSARAAHAEATDEQSKAENKYDTRGLEASYLAEAQTRQASEIEQAIQQFQSLPLADFCSDAPINLGAVVELEQAGKTTTYFIGPRAGGVEITHRGREIIVITPNSPIGQLLVGQKTGAHLRLTVRGGSKECRITSVA